MPELQKSPNWDSRSSANSSAKDDFPFNEGWPKCGPGDGRLFELITCDGARHIAQVDFSTQYRAEGLQWGTLSGQTIYKHMVIAWHEKQTPLDIDLRNTSI